MIGSNLIVAARLVRFFCCRSQHAINVAALVFWRACILFFNSIIVARSGIEWNLIIGARVRENVSFFLILALIVIA